MNRPSFQALRSAAPLTASITVLLILTSMGWAQTSAPLSPSRQLILDRAAARKEAYSAFKLGHDTAAIAILSASTKKSSRPENQELDLGRYLADVSLRFRNEGDAGRAVAVAQYSLLRLESVATGMGSRHAISALSAVASLCENVLGDMVRARQTYERILKIDPTAISAKERLARLSAVESAAEAKATANLLLQQRRAEGGRR